MTTSACSTKVCLENVIKIFPGSAQPALDGINAEIPAGSITALVGPDAAGKSTLMRLLAGLMQPTFGKVLVDGRPACAPGGGSLPQVGYMPQRFGLYEDLSVIDNLSLYAELRKLYGAEREVIFERLLSFTDLKRFQPRLAGRLSGGMKQKLGLACSLLGSPELLLLDEPGVGVDPQSRQELWAMVQELSGQGMTIVWSTAYIEEAERCPHVLVLAEGRLLYQGYPKGFTQRVAGRTFMLSAPQSETSEGFSRTALHHWTNAQGVQDIQVQGSRLRLVFNDQGLELYKNLSAEQGTLEPTLPRLEDAYIDAMGGAAGGTSPFNAFPSLYNQGQRSGRAVIEAQQLTKVFGDFVAAKDITFQVGQGRIFGLLGPNGAGKSTTFRMLCGLSRPTSGECSVAGVNLLQSGSEARAQLGYMAQKFSLYIDLTVEMNIRIFGQLYALPRKVLDARIESLLNALELDKFRHTQTKDLPLGQKQRLALLCATIHHPKALFLDEPTSGVDPRTRREFWKHINALTQLGVAVLVTTHFMEEAEYCDEIALIYRGGMIAHGSPDELKRQSPCIRADPTMEDAFIAYIEAHNEDQ